MSGIVFVNRNGLRWRYARVAKFAAGSSDHETALRLILKSADIRSNFVERSRTTSRPKLEQGLIRAMLAETWITAEEENFRTFMKVLNRNGGGMLFEVLTDEAVDEFMERTLELAIKKANEALARAA